MSGIPQGSEFQVNTTIANSQRTNPAANNAYPPRAIASDRNGNFVVTWTSQAQDGSGGGIYARLYNSLGQPISTEILVNTTTADEQRLASVAMDDDGDFVIVWQSFQDDTDNDTNPDSYGIYARRFSRTGVAQGDEFRVASAFSDQSQATVAMDQDGDFVITWTGDTDIYAALFDNTGGRVDTGGDIVVNPVPDGTQQFSSVATDQNGNFVVVWASDNGDGSGQGIFAQRFDASGARLGPVFRVNFETAGNQTNPSVSMDQDGNFVVAWASENQDSSLYGIYYRRFNSSGDPIDATDQQVNDTILGNQHYPTVSYERDGDSFVISWHSSSTEQPGDTDGAVVVRRYNEFGTAQGPEITVNTYTAGNQEYPSIAIDAESDFVAVWSTVKPLPGESGYGVYGQQFGRSSVTAPSDIDLTPVLILGGLPAVNENASIGTVVGLLSATDNGGTAGPLTFSLVNEVGFDAAAFTIDAATNELRLAQGTDFEARSAYRIKVRVTDADGDTYDEIYEIRVIDSPFELAPTDITLTPASVNENVATNTVVGTLAAVDSEAGDSFTYSLVTGEGSDDNSLFQVDGDQLRILTSPDFETTPEYRIRLRVTDQGGNFYEEAVVITVNNRFELNPTDIALSATSVEENVPGNTLVATVTGTDPEPGDQLTFTLVQGFGDNAAFTLVNGELRIVASPDFETQASYSIRVQATDLGGTIYTEDFTINVTDVPFELAPTDINLTPTQVDENIDPTTVVGTVTGTDPETGAGDQLTFTLVPNFGNNAAFTLVNGELRFVASPDFETQSSYTIRIRATDEGNNTYEEDFTITVNNVISELAPTDISLSRTDIDENAGNGAVVATITGTDADPGDTLSYALVAGTGDTDNGAFTVTGNQLTINTSPNFETKTSYTIRLRVTDSGSRTYEESFTITVNNLFDVSPDDLDLDNTLIGENVPPGTLVATITGSDLEFPQQDSLTYSLPTGNDNASFSVVGNQLFIQVSPDFEVKNSYVVNLRATDRGGNTYDEVFTITVEDVDFEQPPINLSLSATAVNENVGAGAAIATISATDPDANDVLTYSLVAGTGDTDNAAFTVVGNQLQINDSPDFETQPTYSIRLRVRDQGNNVVEQAFTITVNDLSDIAPTNLALSATSIDENADSTVAIATISANDVEPGDDLTYTLATGAGSTDNGAFTITNNQLFINASPDFEAKSSYNIRLRATDEGNNFVEQTFTITITNLFDEDPTNLALSATSINENAGDGAVVGTLSADDADAGDTLIYSLVAGAGDTDNAAFTITDDQLSIDTSPDFETKSSYSIRVQVEDQGGNIAVQTFTITINDRPDIAPTDLTISTTNINENVGTTNPIATFSANDVEPGDSLTYTLVTGVGSGDNGAFTITNNQLFINASPDFETKSSYNIRVRVADEGNNFIEQAFTITVNDLSDIAPTNLALSSTSVVENADSTVAIATISANDVEPGDDLTYTLATGAGSTDNGAFTITNNQLFINASPDFETKSSYNIRLRATDEGNNFVEQTFTITITNLFDIAPTNLTLSATSVNENVAANTLVGTIAATDVETGDTLTYSLATDFGDHNAFTIVNNNELRLVASPDFETQPSYTIRLRAQDRGNNVINRDFTITVNNLPEGTPPNDIALSANRVDENVAPGTVVGTLSATDPDGTTAFTYSLVNAAGYDTSAFTIVGNELRMAVRPDYETKSLYRIRIRVQDAGGATYDEDFIISVNDLAENRTPTDITLTSTAIAEGAPAGSTIGTLVTADPDPGDTFTYTLVDEAGLDTSRFTINGSTLAINEVPDYETINSYRIRIRTTDAGGLSREELFTITVLDRQETNPPTSLNLSSSSIAENVSPGSVVGTLTAVDPDPGESITYTLVSGAGDTDNAAFQIVGNQLQIVASPDFESQANYTVRVRATDRQGNFIEREFAIAIIDQQDDTGSTTAPLLDLNGAEAGVDYSAPFTPGIPVRLMADTATLSDIDSPNLVSAAVVIVNPLNTPNEILAVNVSGTTLRADYSISTGVLTLTGNASLEDYLRVLKTVTYNNTITVPGDDPRTLVFVLDDGVNTNEVAMAHLIPTFATAIQGTEGSDPSLMTTPRTDLLTALGGNDVVTSTLENLQQDDRIDGGAGVDTLNITNGTGNLTITVANTDHQLTGLALETRIINFENFNLTGFQGTARLTGTNAVELLIGGNGNDTLNGLGGNDALGGGDGNDVLNGGAGSDTLSGGSGNDTYFVESSVDRIVEGFNAGVDQVWAASSYILPIHVDNLNLYGAARNGFGNDQANRIIGNNFNNQLNGFGGNDVLLAAGGNDALFGGLGNDTMNGGVGNDTYFVDSALDSVIEYANAGVDLVWASINHVLRANVENLNLNGSARNGFGNALGNRIAGNAVANVLSGLDGNDELVGGFGSDTLVGGNGNDRLIGDVGQDILNGGLGNDSFILSAGITARGDTIQDFNSANDSMVFSLSTLSLLIPTNIPNTIRPGFLLASQLALGTTARNATQRFVYDRSLGNLYFDPDGSGAAGRTLLVRLQNRAVINNTDIVITA